MARYIDAEELCRRLNECWETNDINKGRLIQQVIDRVITPIVVGTPSADVEEVVRCKDCECGEIEDIDFPDQYLCHYHGSWWNNGNHFCSYGKKKGEM